MRPTSTNRRSFLLSSTAAATAAAAAALHAAARPGDASDAPAAAQPQRLHIATNVYPWGTFERRLGRDWDELQKANLQRIKAAGLDGYEPIGSSPEQVQQLGTLLQSVDLELRSLYVNSTLHEPDDAAASRDQILAIAAAAQPFGCRIIVTNPNPVRWGGPEDKSDTQLQTQARALDSLGADLRKTGQVLAYHYHDAELRQAAREFHHMLVGTNPDNLTLCLDAHWTFRASGNSQVALFDVVELYGPRISELHLRQSSGGIWTEAFTPEGDIDYTRLARRLAELEVHPHIVLEQAVEEGTPNTLTADEAHRLGAEAARRLFSTPAA